MASLLICGRKKGKKKAGNGLIKEKYVSFFCG